MHQKRLAISKLWPIPRKGRTFIVVASNNKTQGIPVLVAMRNILGHVQTRKELKKIMLEGKVEVNGVVIRDEKYSLLLFDVLGLPTLKKYYRVGLSEFKKIIFDEISAKEINSKIVKVSGKKILSKGRVQLNMRDGRNVLSKDKVSVGDSVVINLKDKKIERVLPIKEKSEVLVIKGKHLGRKGNVSKVEGNEVNVSLEEGDFNLNKNAVMALS
jgi:small subunit ribosomal protein S4e